MIKLIFATNNDNKVKEIRSVLPKDFQIVSLEEAGIDRDIPEPHDNLEDNAREKAWTIYKETNTNCFSEDTGLEVEALGGEPGVNSARYAGELRSFSANIDKLLKALNGQTNRKARFRTVICLVLNGREYMFEGTCNGTITDDKKGSAGFGYDPVFVPEGSSKTFAEMSTTEKSDCSHRAKAVAKLVVFLKHLNTKQQS